MKKVLSIAGMSCQHCVARAMKALNSIEGVEAQVNLKKKSATVELSQDVEDGVFERALEEANLKLVSVKEKKGLFG